ncbi:hypothetical protein SASPL_101748 [Salvia splendens]|uniref:EamA domain-containing protein n=1 Tax=Salvia splendens TaxID=180675 RepID=A0A8X9AE02_SALSN|nr:hypothetical protein SASPL_101748 [Salvia splendens]
MAWNCCCSSTFSATTAIYAAARTPNTFTITLQRRNAFSQSIRNPINQIAPSNFSAKSKATESEFKTESNEIDCIGTGLDVECVISEESEQVRGEARDTASALVELALEWGLLISPFFFWGTAMVAMKEVLPKTGPFVVAAFRLIPSGLLLVAFAASRGRALPSGFNAWFSISAFAAIDASCFQLGFLAQGLEGTTAGLGSVIIDSQPLTVAILASLLFGESIGYIGAAGLVLGVIGLLLLEVSIFKVSTFRATYSSLF